MCVSALAANPGSVGCGVGSVCAAVCTCVVVLLSYEVRLCFNTARENVALERLL